MKEEWGIQVFILATDETGRDQIYNWLKTQIESEKPNGRIAAPVRMIKTFREVNESSSVQEEF